MWLFCESLAHFMAFLFVLVTFERILDGFMRFWTNPETQDGDQDSRHSEMVLLLLRHVTSFPHNSNVKGDIFRHTMYPPRVVVIAFILSDLRKGEGGDPSPRS